MGPATEILAQSRSGLGYKVSASFHSALASRPEDSTDRFTRSLVELLSTSDGGRFGLRAVESASIVLQLSVLIPNYNHGHYLEDCLRSVFEQKTDQVEVLVCDDGSTDNSLEVLQGLQNRYPELRLLVHEQNRGLHEALSTLIDESKGKYLYTLSADEMLLPGMFQAVATAFEVSPEPYWIFFDFVAEVETEAGLRRDVYTFGGEEGTRTPADFQRRLSQMPWFPLGGANSIWHSQKLRELWPVTKRMGPFVDTYPAAALAFRYGGYYVPGCFNVFRILPGSYGSLIHDVRRAGPYYRLLLERLRDPEMKDVARGVRGSALLAHYGWPPLVEILRSPVNWYLITPMFVWRLLTAQIGRWMLRRSRFLYSRLKSVYRALDSALGQSTRKRQ